MTPRPRGRAHATAFLLALAAAGFPACRPPDAPRVTAAWSGRPEAGRDNDVHLQLTDAASGPIAGARLQVQAFMTHPGMAPVPAALEETGGGGYRVRVRFTMGGDWWLRVTGALPGGESIDAEVAVPGVAAPQ